MKFIFRKLRQGALLWPALFALTACQGAGTNAEGSIGGSTAELLLGPVISAVTVPSPSAPAPATCQGGAPALPHAFTDGGDTLMIEGLNFQQGARVRVGKQNLLEANIVNVTATSIEVVTPPGSPGDTDVVVINPDNLLAIQRAAVRLCARTGATAAGARVVAAPSRVQVGDQISVELQVFPGTEDDLRGLGPTIAFDPSGFAGGDRLAGPLPAGADLLVASPPAVFRYTFLAAEEGEFVLNGTVAGINTEIGDNVTIGPVLSNIVRVEPLLTSASADRTSAAIDQLVRLSVQVANAGAQTVRHVRGEGTDPDGDAGPISPEPIPTVSGTGALALQSVSASITSGTGECRDDVDPDGDTGPLPVIPACDLAPSSIARFDYIFRATQPGFVSFEANAASVLTLEPAGVTPTQLVFSAPPPAEIVARAPWPEVTVEVRDDTGRRVTTFSDAVTLSLGVGTDLLQGTLTATAVEGVARFGNLVYDTAEEIELTASTPGLVGTSAPATVDVLPFGAPAQLVFGTAPRASETANFPWPSFSVRVLDLYGNLVRDASIAVSIQRTTGTGKFTGIRTRLPDLGIATFLDLRYDTAESMTFQVTAPGVAPLIGVPVEVFTNAPAQLVLATPVPATVAQGETWPSFTVKIVDGAGTDPAAFAGPITITRASGSGTLSGMTVSAGAVMQFVPANLSYNVAEAITLDITAPGLTGIFGVPVTVEPVGTVADHLAFGVPPRAVEITGQNWEPFTVRVEDAGGALVTAAGGTLTLAKTSGAGMIARGSAPIERGVARFTQVAYNATDTLTFDVAWLAQPGVAPVAGTAVDVLAPGAAQLGFGTPPAAAQEAGATWPAFTVEIQDASGRRVAGATNPVTLSLATGGDKLDGTLTRAAINGAATFNDISYDLVESIDLDADAPGLLGLAMEPIDVGAAVPLRLLVHRAPRAVETANGIWAPMAARIAGTGGKLARGASDTVALGVATGGGGGVLSGTLMVSAADGIARFTDARFDTPSGLQVAFSGAGMQTSPLSFIAVLEAGVTPVRMRVDVPPAPFEAVGAQWQPFSLRIEDEDGRLVTQPAADVAVTIELRSGTGLLTGTTTRTAVDGIVTFDDLRYDTAENISYDFTSAGLERLFGTARGLSRTIGIISITAIP